MQPFKVVLCGLNSRYVHTALAPRCLTSAVREALSSSSVSCSIVEGTVNEPAEAVLSRIREEAPDLLGLSCYVWNIREMLSLANAYKKAHPQTTVVLGGPEVSYRPAELLTAHSFVDCILSGEGEETLPLLIRACLGEIPLRQVPALSYRTPEGDLAVSEPYVGLSDPISPYAHTDLSCLSGRIAYIEASRGCPYRCTFCLSGHSGGVRYFDAERVKADVLHLAENDVRVIKFVDRTFNANRAYAHSLWRWIGEEYGRGLPTGTRLHFEIAGERLDEESFTILSALPVGAVQLEVGLQSFHPPTLCAIHRNPNTDRLEENVRRLIALGTVHVHVDLIAGLPEEDLPTFIRGFDRAYALGAHMLQLGFLKLLPGAPMTGEGADRYDCRYSSDPPYEVIETSAITADELDQLRLCEDVLERISNSGRFRRTLAYLISERGISPYSLFLGFAKYRKEHQIPTALDPYTNAFARYAAELPGVDRNTLLDRMVMDRLATNSSGVIPEGIRKFDKRLKHIRSALNAVPEARETPGVRRTLASLWGEDTVVWVDYRDPHPITGEYSVVSLPIGYLLPDGAEK